MDPNNYDFSREAQVQGFIRAVIDQRSASIEAEIVFYLGVSDATRKDMNIEYYKADGSMAVFDKKKEILYYTPVRVEGDEVIFEFKRLWNE